MSHRDNYAAADRLLARYGASGGELRERGRAAMKAFVLACRRLSPDAAAKVADSPPTDGRLTMKKAPREPLPP